MKLSALLVCLAFAALSGSVAAQEPQPPPVAPAPPSATPPPAPAADPARPASRVYLGLQIGIFKPSGNDLDPFSFNTAPAGEALVGFRLNRYLSLEAGLGYHENGTDALSANVGTTFASVEFELSDIPITASVRAGVDVDRVTLYGLAGVGYHMTKLKVKLFSGLASGSISDEDNVLGWHIGAGLAVAITPRLSLGAEVRRTFATAKYPDLLGPDAPTADMKIGGLQLGATVTFGL